MLANVLTILWAAALLAAAPGRAAGADAPGRSGPRTFQRGANFGN